MKKSILQIGEIKDSEPKRREEHEALGKKKKKCQVSNTMACVIGSFEVSNHFWKDQVEVTSEAIGTVTPYNGGTWDSNWFVW